MPCGWCSINTSWNEESHSRMFQNSSSPPFPTHLVWVPPTSSPLCCISCTCPLVLCVPHCLPSPNMPVVVLLQSLWTCCPLCLKCSPTPHFCGAVFLTPLRSEVESHFLLDAFPAHPFWSSTSQTFPIPFPHLFAKDLSWFYILCVYLLVLFTIIQAALAQRLLSVSFTTQHILIFNSCLL